MNQQVTYLKQLDGTVKSIPKPLETRLTLRNVVLKAQVGLQDVDATLACYNKQKGSATVIRQLEFALSKLEISVDELIVALHLFCLESFP
jgi:hypothetical protein